MFGLDVICYTLPQIFDRVSSSRVLRWDPHRENPWDVRLHRRFVVGPGGISVRGRDISGVWILFPFRSIRILSSGCLYFYFFYFSIWLFVFKDWFSVDYLEDGVKDLILLIRVVFDHLLFASSLPFIFGIKRVSFFFHMDL